MTAPFKDQHRGGHQEPDQLPAPEYRPDQPDAEDHAHRWEDDRGEGKRMGERIIKMTGGQSAPDSDIDPEDGRQGNPERGHDARHPVPEVAHRDHHEPQRGQGQQVKRPPGSGFILGQAARVVHSMASLGARARPAVVVIQGHQRSTGLASQPSTSGHPRAGPVVSVSAGTGRFRGRFLAAYALRACHVRWVAGSKPPPATSLARETTGSWDTRSKNADRASHSPSCRTGTASGRTANPPTPHDRQPIACP